MRSRHSRAVAEVRPVPLPQIQSPGQKSEYYGLLAFLNNTYEAQSWIYTEEQQKAAKVRESVAAVEDRLKKQHPDCGSRIAAWQSASLSCGNRLLGRWSRRKTHSSSELNHPTVLPDKRHPHPGASHHLRGRSHPGETEDGKRHRSPLEVAQAQRPALRRSRGAVSAAPGRSPNWWSKPGNPGATPGKG